MPNWAQEKASLSQRTPHSHSPPPTVKVLPCRFAIRNRRTRQASTLTSTYDHPCENKHARDRTQYGRARGSTRNFFLHHTRMITKAAVVRDATMIREQVQCLRQRVCTAHAGAGDVS